MSSCAGFCSTCCRAALCASATSAFLPTGNEQYSCHSVFDCWAQIGPHARLLHQPLPRRTHAGTVLSVAELCRSLNVSVPLNFSSDLHPTPAGGQHETTRPASNHSRAPARTLVVCLICFRVSSRSPLHAPAVACPPRFSVLSPTASVLHRPQ
jgi:hypothetical protein